MNRTSSITQTLVGKKCIRECKIRKFFTNYEYLSNTKQLWGHYVHVQTGVIVSAHSSHSSSSPLQLGKYVDEVRDQLICFFVFVCFM